MSIYHVGTTVPDQEHAEKTFTRAEEQKNIKFGPIHKERQKTSWGLVWYDYWAETIE